MSLRFTLELKTNLSYFYSGMDRCERNKRVPGALNGIKPLLPSKQHQSAWLKGKEIAGFVQIIIVMKPFYLYI